MNTIHTFSDLLIFFSGAIVGVAVGIYIYSKLSARVHAAANKIEIAAAAAVVKIEAAAHTAADKVEQTAKNLKV